MYTTFVFSVALDKVNHHLDCSWQIVQGESCNWAGLYISCVSVGDRKYPRRKKLNRVRRFIFTRFRSYRERISWCTWRKKLLLPKKKSILHIISQISIPKKKREKRKNRINQDKSLSNDISRIPINSESAKLSGKPSKNCSTNRYTKNHLSKLSFPLSPSFV